MGHKKFARHMLGNMTQTTTVTVPYVRRSELWDIKKFARHITGKQMTRVAVPYVGCSELWDIKSSQGILLGSK